MFQKICIKDKESEGSTLDIAFLIDSMLFYNKVVLLVHREELNILFREFGDDTLRELMNSGRLEIMFRNNMIGSIIAPNGGYGLSTFKGKDITVHSVLYEISRRDNRNSLKNLKFADEFGSLILPYNYPDDFEKIVLEEYNDSSLLLKKIPAYFNEIAPFYKLPENIEVEILKDGNFGPFETYKVQSNIDLVHFNEEFKKHNPDKSYQVDYSGFLLALAESKGDIYIATDLETEIVTSNLYSKFIEIEVAELIRKRNKSADELNLFGDYILENCYSLGTAFVEGIISRKDLLNILDSSDEFRHWLFDIENDKSLIGEYHKAVSKKNFSDKIPTRTARFIIFEGLGVAADLFSGGVLGMAVGSTLSAFDEIFIDKIINRSWRPNQFIDNTLKPKIKF